MDEGRSKKRPNLQVKRIRVQKCSVEMVPGPFKKLVSVVLNKVYINIFGERIKMIKFIY